MSELLLYGLNDNGEPAFSEELAAGDRGRLQAVAQARLSQWHGVEVWDGPLCVLRLRRRTAAD